jgi:hypothetical protein
MELYEESLLGGSEVSTFIWRIFVLDNEDLMFPSPIPETMSSFISCGSLCRRDVN